MAQSEFTMSSSAYGQQATSPSEEFFQHTVDEKVPLTQAEVYDPQQQAGGSYNMPYPEPPPSYSQSEGVQKQGPYPPAGTYAQPPPAPYPTQQQPVMAPPLQLQPVIAQPPTVTVVPVCQPQPTVVVVGSQALTPGTCSVCRKGKIKKSPSCCSWFCCILLLPAFIIPGLIALFCCCQKPKCTHCKYSP